MQLLTILVGISLLLAGCQPNNDEPCRPIFVDTISVDANLASVAPYNDNDSVLFRYNVTDSVYIKVSSIKPAGNTVEVVVNPECPPDQHYFLTKRFLLGDSALTNKFQTTVSINSYTRSLIINLGGFVAEITENEINNGKPFADSLQVQNVWHKRVFRWEGQTDTILYNKKSGIIGLFSKGKRWNLIK